MRSLLWLCLLAGVLAFAWFLAPREVVDRTISFDPASIPNDIDGWLAGREGAVSDLRPDDAKEIVWSGTTGQSTKYSIVYLHGFSASKWEIRPVPDRVAQGLKANLYFPRLSGHGRSGAAMAEPAAGDWVEDLAEAIAIGRRLGERVILVGTSTGATLAALAATDPKLSEGLAGVVLISPNFALNNRMAWILELPYARRWLPMIAGGERSFQPVNEDHAKHWTMRYPTVSVIPMVTLMDHVRRIDLGTAHVPALFVWSPEDRVIDPRAVEAAAAEWGGPVTLDQVTLEEGDDPMRHVIAGRILSPARTDGVADAILNWAQRLP